MLGQAFVQPIPPCMLKNCRNIAPITELCGLHINFGTGNIQATVFLNLTPHTGLPNMYKNTSVLQFQGILTAPMKLSPLQASVFNFVYFNNGVPITTNTASSFASATSGNFSFLITVVNSTKEQIDSLFAFVNSPNYEGALKQIYKTTATIDVQTQTSRFYESNPFPMSSHAASTSIFSTVMLSVFFAVFMLYSHI
jgi:hypothetical protein